MISLLLLEEVSILVLLLYVYYIFRKKAIQHLENGGLLQSNENIKNSADHRVGLFTLRTKLKVSFLLILEKKVFIPVFISMALIPNCFASGLKIFGIYY